MKICILTNELSTKNGWGRYSVDLIENLKNSADLTIIIAKDGKNETDLKTIKILPPALAYKQNYFLSFWYAWRLRKIVKGHDIIHSFIEPYSCIAYFLSKLTGKSYSITTHGSYGIFSFVNLPFYLRYFHKKSFQKARKIICVSNYTKKQLVKHDLGNLVVINNGINFENFYKSPIPSFEEREDLILSVGALKPRKGYHVSILAFAKVLQKFPDFRYLIVGDQSNKEYFEHLKNLTKELKIDGKVIFYESISHQELLSFYKRAKAFVLTSISENGYFEGFGLVYLEANACGLPVVGTKDCGAEDAIKDGKTGFLVSQKNSEEIAKAIIKILEDKDLAQKLGENGMIWAKEHDWSTIIHKYFEIYTL